MSDWEPEWWNEPYADTVRDLRRALWAPPFRLRYAPRPLSIWAASASWPPLHTLVGLMWVLPRYRDEDLLAVPGLGPAGVREIRQAQRIAWSDPWMRHAWMQLGRD